MDIEVLADAASVAARGAEFIAEQARQAVADRGRFLFAVSGGKTPWAMLKDLAKENAPWDKVHVFQVDERVAPDGDPDRNLTHLTESLKGVPIPPDNFYPMPVTMPDLTAAAAAYAATLEEAAGSPPILDLIHLGLGDDGHTASLVPGDPVLDVTNTAVAVTGIYQGRQRLTLTYPVLGRARMLVWLVTGAGKSAPLRAFVQGDESIPAGRVVNRNMTVICDRASQGL